MSNDMLNMRVRYKFKEDRKYVEITVTKEQYVNLLEVDAIESCQVIKAPKKPNSITEKKRPNKRITLIAKMTKSRKTHPVKSVDSL